jgi:hypothetical protein
MGHYRPIVREVFVEIRLLEMSKKEEVLIRSGKMQVEKD